MTWKKKDNLESLEQLQAKLRGAIPTAAKDGSATLGMDRTELEALIATMEERLGTLPPDSAKAEETREILRRLHGVLNEMLD